MRYSRAKLAIGSYFFMVNLAANVNASVETGKREMPQFIDPARPQWPQFVIIGATMCSIDVVVMSAYALLSSRARRRRRTASSAASSSAPASCSPRRDGLDAPGIIVYEQEVGDSLSGPPVWLHRKTHSGLKPRP